MEKYFQDFEEVDEVDCVFYMIIVKVSGNMVNYFIMENLWWMCVELLDVCDMYVVVCDEDFYKCVDEYVVIFIVLKEYNLDKVCKVMWVYFF